MKKKKILYSFLGLLCAGQLAAQELAVKETWLSGAARSVIYNDSYSNQTETDTLTPSKTLSGHTLLDLAANIKPTKNIFIHSDIRVRNDHGGFWGSGLTLDLRQLYLRGVVANAFRYQIGDINYKLTPFTYFNSDEELMQYEPAVFGWMRDQNQYDLFYTKDNTWRQQGLSGEFGLTFKKGIEGIDFTLFTTRLTATLGSPTLERLHSGGGLFIAHSDLLDFQFHYAHAYDLEGTGSSPDRFNNPVATGGVGLHKDFSDWRADLASEFGGSRAFSVIGEDSLDIADYFIDFEVKLTNASKKLTLVGQYANVGPNFRSIGAQTRRADFNSQALAYQRYGNDQVVRELSSFDLIRDASIYNTRLQTNLMAYNPSYGNMEPYGAATPNRNTVRLKADWKGLDGWLSVNAQTAASREIIGQGTASLRNFTRMGGQASVHLDKLDLIKNKTTFTISTIMEQTKRTGESEFEKVDLSNSIINIGLEVGLVEKLSFLAGVRWISSKGFDYQTQFNPLGEIITFNGDDTDRAEQMTAAALRYSFSERSMLNFQYTKYDWTDKTNATENYSIGNWSLIYAMTF